MLISAVGMLLLLASSASAAPPVYIAAILTVLSQQPETDPFLDQVNAELDRREDGETAADGATAPTQARGIFYYLRVFSGLCLVIALILAVGYAARRAAGRTPLLAGAELGRVLGHIYLNRNATIFFIETGGKVVLIGVTTQSVTTLAQFDAAVFNDEEEPTQPAQFDPESFLAQLDASSQAFRPDTAPRDDDDMLSLRRDIQRLQDYLREESRETSD